MSCYCKKFAASFHTISDKIVQIYFLSDRMDEYLHTIKNLLNSKNKKIKKVYS